MLTHVLCDSKLPAIITFKCLVSHSGDLLSSDPRTYQPATHNPKVLASKEYYPTLLQSNLEVAAIICQNRLKG